MSLTDAEQYLLELINRGRLNPLGEADRYGVGLNEGLDAGTISSGPLQVLAQNDLLSNAAADHSAWMLQTNTFSHTGRGGSSPGDRMAAADYEFTGAWSWRENLAWSGTTGTMDLEGIIEEQYAGLYRSPGHRVNTFASEVTEIGIGQVRGSFTQDGNVYDSSMLTENFATSGGDQFVTGVAYRDADRDAFYSIGEGQGGISFLTGGSQESTAPSGGYSLNVGGLAEVRLTVGQGEVTYAVLDVDLSAGNAKVDLVTAADGARYLALSADTDMISGVADARLLGRGDIMLRGTDDRNVLTGNSGDNRIYGEGAGDIIYGGGGADRIAAGDGWDRVGAGSGDDQVWGGIGRDKIWGSTGEDNIKGGADGDSLYGGAGDDRLYGDHGGDRLYGGAGDDSMWGGTGNDTMQGGMGADYLNGGMGADVLYGYTGNDRLSGSDGYDRLYGGAGNDSMWGGIGNDAMQGGLGADYLHGGMGADVLYGYTGNDLLNGALGNDKMTGGAGADTFIFTAGADQVMDFENNVDTILIYQSVAGVGVDKADVMALGEIVNGDAVFDFGDGNVLTVRDVASLGVLENDLNLL
uniref:CAP domain-containing protein n=2 Tax=Yoonia sp. TaxID=2212373 RepID=UPI004048117D